MVHGVFIGLKVLTVLTGMHTREQDISSLPASWAWYNRPSYTSKCQWSAVSCNTLIESMRIMWLIYTDSETWQLGALKIQLKRYILCGFTWQWETDKIYYWSWNCKAKYFNMKWKVFFTTNSVHTIVMMCRSNVLLKDCKLWNNSWPWLKKLIIWNSNIYQLTIWFTFYVPTCVKVMLCQFG